MKITVISTCTNSKAVSSAQQLTLDDFRRGAGHVAQRKAELASLCLPAGRMYTGDQHVRLMRGVEAARAAGHEVDVWIVSAGFGVIPETEPIVPYEATFNDMRKAERTEWADTLDIAPRVRDILHNRSDLTMMLLSDRYLDAARVDDIDEVGGPTWAVCGSSATNRFPPPIRTVPLTQADTSRFGAMMIGLKGAVAAAALTSPNPAYALYSMATDPRQLALF